jgi:hypothetical protein
VDVLLDLLGALGFGAKALGAVALLYAGVAAVLAVGALVLKVLGAACRNKRLDDASERLMAWSWRFWRPLGTRVEKRE